jgi:hypothetical protein
MKLVVVRKIVERFDEPVADEFCPYSIDEGAGEEVISRVGDKLGELGS